MSFMYDAGRNAFARAKIAWKAAGGSTIRAQLIDTSAYTASQSLDEVLADIPAEARIGDPVTLTLLDPEAGMCDADDVTTTNISGPAVGALVLYKDTGNENTSTLIDYIDDVDGLPFTPNGLPVDITWSNAAHVTEEDRGTPRVTRRRPDVIRKMEEMVLLYDLRKAA